MNVAMVNCRLMPYVSGESALGPNSKVHQGPRYQYWYGLNDLRVRSARQIAEADEAHNDDQERCAVA